MLFNKYLNRVLIKEHTGSILLMTFEEIIMQDYTFVFADHEFDLNNPTIQSWLQSYFDDNWYLLVDHYNGDYEGHLFFDDWFNEEQIEQLFYGAFVGAVYDNLLDDIKVAATIAEVKYNNDLDVVGLDHFKYVLECICDMIPFDFHSEDSPFDIDSVDCAFEYFIEEWVSCCAFDGDDSFLREFITVLIEGTNEVDYIATIDLDNLDTEALKDNRDFVELFEQWMRTVKTYGNGGFDALDHSTATEVAEWCSDVLSCEE